MGNGVSVGRGVSVGGRTSVIVGGRILSAPPHASVVRMSTTPTIILRYIAFSEAYTATCDTINPKRGSSFLPDGAFVAFPSQVPPTQLRNTRTLGQISIAVRIWEFF